MSDDVHHGHPTGVPVPRPGVGGPEPVAVDDTLAEVLWRSRELGFLGQGGIQAHVRNARAFVAELGPVRRVVDLGSGGGVPGLVVAVDRPDLDLVLVEAAQRRVDFLLDVVEELGLTRHVVVEHGRAEELARRPDLRGTFDVVTARSFATPAVTAECAVGFMSGPGATLLVSEPPTDPGDRWPEVGLARLGLTPGQRRDHGGTTIQRIDMTRACDERYPRRVGIPAKRPLF